MVNAIQSSDTSDLVRKGGYSTKIEEIEKKIPNHDKYITTKEFNKLIKEDFAERLKKVNLASNSDTADFVKETNFDEKLVKINSKVT